MFQPAQWWKWNFQISVQEIKEMDSMKLSDILTGIQVLAASAPMDQEIIGISYDSRTVKPGQLFVAVTGFASDGHRFIHMAMEKGAAAVLCQRMPEGNEPYVQVTDTRLALALASATILDIPPNVCSLLVLRGPTEKPRPPICSSTFWRKPETPRWDWWERSRI